ncbi:hypothetical protein ACFVGY_33065 [Streptomyces sp. NPDC127106]
MRRRAVLDVVGEAGGVVTGGDEESGVDESGDRGSFVWRTSPSRYAS